VFLPLCFPWLPPLVTSAGKIDGTTPGKIARNITLDTPEGRPWACYRKNVCRGSAASGKPFLKGSNSERVFSEGTHRRSSMAEQCREREWENRAGLGDVLSYVHGAAALETRSAQLNARNARYILLERHTAVASHGANLQRMWVGQLRESS
jgi:hypothetical protein